MGINYTNEKGKTAAPVPAVYNGEDSKAKGKFGFAVQRATKNQGGRLRAKTVDLSLRSV